MKNPWKNVNLGPQRQNFTGMGNFFMLLARQSGGKTSIKEEERRKKKKEKEEEKREKTVVIYHISNLQFIFYVPVILNIVNKLYSSCMVGLGKAE